MLHKISADNSGGIVVHKGDTIEIQLEETPAAGFSWEVVGIDNHIAELQSSDYKLNNGAAIGNSGMRTMVFSISGQGNGKIKLKNAQRWTGDVYKRFELELTVE